MVEFSASPIFAVANPISMTLQGTPMQKPSSTLATLAFLVCFLVLIVHQHFFMSSQLLSSGASSLEHINVWTLRHLTMYSPLIPGAQGTYPLSAKNDIQSTVNISLLSLLSKFPLLLSGQIKLNVLVYTI
jgi:hypothetical protein